MAVAVVAPAALPVVATPLPEDDIAPRPHRQEASSNPARTVGGRSRSSSGPASSLAARSSPARYYEDLPTADAEAAAAARRRRQGGLLAALCSSMVAAVCFAILEITSHADDTNLEQLHDITTSSLVCDKVDEDFLLQKPRKIDHLLPASTVSTSERSCSRRQATDVGNDYSTSSIIQDFRSLLSFALGMFVCSLTTRQIPAAGPGPMTGNAHQHHTTDAADSSSLHGRDALADSDADNEEHLKKVKLYLYLF